MTNIIQIHHIESSSVVDGPGKRAVLFVQGCTLACPGCQNKKLWPAEGGRAAPVDDLAVTLATLAASNGGNVTLSGGEIMQQPAAIAELVARLRGLGVKHIIAYTGYTWEQLFDTYHPARPWLQAILEYVDVLVDGPFIRALDDPFITYRGSRNQRPIDVIESLFAGHVVTLDWSAPEIILTEDGSLVLPDGLAAELAEMGPTSRARMCGEVRRA